MPASSSSCTSCQRFWREPGALVCASSSTRTAPGLRASAASRSNSSSVRPRYSTSLPRQDVEPVRAAPRSRRGRASRPRRPRRRCLRRAARARPRASRRSCRRRATRRRRSSAAAPRRASSRLDAPAARRDRGASSCMPCVGESDVPPGTCRRATGHRVSVTQRSISASAQRSIEREVERQHVDARLAEDAERRGLRCAASTSARHRSAGERRARAPRAPTWYCARRRR